MADQHHDNIPAVANTIQDDILKIKETLGFHKDAFERVGSGWSDTSTGSFYIKFTQSGTGAVASTMNTKFGERVSVKDFGATGDGDTDDTAAIQAAFDAMGEYGTLIFPAGKYKTNGCITVSEVDYLSVVLEGCTFLVGDTGDNGTMLNSAEGKIGYLFQSCDFLQITGSAYFVGSGELGTTTLLALVIENCTYCNCQAFMRFSTMAWGRFICGCNLGLFADCVGHSMRGVQPFGVANAGTVEVIAGCNYSSFGNAVGYNMDKPVRYMNVATSYGDNQWCTVGDTVCHGYSSSTTAMALAIRSAVDCAFGKVITNAASFGLMVVQYSGDQAAGWNVNRISIEAVIGNAPASDASVDTIVYIESQDSATLGRIHIGRVSATCAGEYGVWVVAGDVTIGEVFLTGAATRLLAVYSSYAAWVTSLSIGKLIITGNAGASIPVTVGKGGRLQIDYVDLQSGPTADLSAAIRYDPDRGDNHGNHYGLYLGTIRYQRGGSTHPYDYAVLDQINSIEMGSIGHVAELEGAFTTGDALYGSDVFWVRHGQLISAAAPTTKTWTRGRVIWNSAAAGSGAPGWVCSSSGTFSSATDNTGDTDGATAVITGMTDTSDFLIGEYVTVSAGFPTTGPYRIIAKTSTTMTITVNSDSSQSNITVSTPDPVFKAMANLAA